ncbi:hypothetical protein [Oleiharenicola sp. Vm1]|uniref:hypothetical protein n=1 Tax=Oleiharenicola sp. Vm1 TaxID=3398393 RepID=UPI0039F4D5D2
MRRHGGAGRRENQLRVESSRALRLAIVDADRRAAGHDALHTAFAEALAFELGRRCQEPVPVKPQAPDADRAAWGLANGSFDVGLVVGSGLPRAMINSDFEVLKATQTAGKGRFALYFIIRKEDAGLAAMLTAAFPEALKGQFFLRAVAKANGQELPEEWQVAVAAK